jgi:pSer/pThr/pTyr-binding forkhead associated (FHA) protein
MRQGAGGDVMPGQENQMGMLVLKFETSVLQEVPIGNAPISIGRAPDNAIHIDNLAVSNYHARVYTDGGRLTVEDLDSLNGTFLNNNRVKKEWLRSGDAIHVGKHIIVVDQEHNVTMSGGVARKLPAPKVDETYVLAGSHNHVQQTDNPDAATRVRIPSLIVIKGKTSEKDYLLSNKLTMIGKSPMATVRLRGWFAPQVAAQISKNQNGYYLGLTSRPPKINGQRVKPPVKLNDGDLIEVAGVVLKFMYRD